MKRILQQLVYFKGIAISQISTASVSLLASSAMAIMIVRTEKRLTTPYRRIIFGVSVADIVFSFTLVTAPFFVPDNIPNSWGVGSEGTCQMVGFMLLLSVNIVPMYTCFLCWYYLCKLKYHMTNEAFARKYEWKGHICITLFCLILTLSALCLDTIHPTAYKTTCQLAVTPLGCGFYPHIVGECDTTTETRVKVSVLINNGLRIFWLLVMIAIMGLLYQHVIFTNRIFQLSTAVINQDEELLGEDGASREEDTNDPEIGGSQSQMQPQQLNITDRTMMRNAQKLATLYRRETALQGTCYVGAYCLTYVPTVITNFVIVVSDEYSPNFIVKIAAMLNPLGGLFMIMVYTRPQIAHLQRSNPELYWFKAFWFVLKAGGEVPEEPSDAITINNRNRGLGRRGRLGRLRLQQQRQPMRGIADSPISSVQFGIEPISSASDNYSTIGIPHGLSTAGEENGTAASIQEGELNYCPESLWSHLEGGSINSSSSSASS